MGFFDLSSKKVKKGNTSSASHQTNASASQPQAPRPQPSLATPAWYSPTASPPLPPLSLRPAGLLAPPPGWTACAPAPPPYQQVPPYGPVVVNQNYYLSPPPSFQGFQQTPQTSAGRLLSKFNLNSVADLAEDICPGTGLPQLFVDDTGRWYGAHMIDQSAALYDQISTKFNDVMTHIDGDRYTGNENDLFVFQPGQIPLHASAPSTWSPPNQALSKKDKRHHPRDNPKGQTTAVAASVISGGYFAKVELYANSRLPMNLPPLRLYIPTFPLLCLAAQYSERVYDRPRGAERDAHVDADWRTGTKAMVIKSVAMDQLSAIVFAIRGTATFMDWAVNLNMAPTSPRGFLDDPGNLCHTGFLSAARKMITPVAARLRQLLQEDPGRASYSLLITGHSAGGAIASLLYAHMLATSTAAQSELNALTGAFRRVHCVSFGAPPVSLLPLSKPAGDSRLRKSLFFAFVNEGDPVARADRAYVRSLLELFAAPPPTQASDKARKTAKPKDKKSKSSSAAKSSASSSKSSTSGGSSGSRSGPVWRVPHCTLSNAGRIVVLRSGKALPRGGARKTVEERLNEGVVAHVATDEQLRGVIWGDPVCHVMRLYAGRIETLAVGAVTAQGG